MLYTLIIAHTLMQANSLLWVNDCPNFLYRQLKCLKTALWFKRFSLSHLNIHSGKPNDNMVTPWFKKNRRGIYWKCGCTLGHYPLCYFFLFSTHESKRVLWVLKDAIINSHNQRLPVFWINQYYIITHYWPWFILMYLSCFMRYGPYIFYNFRWFHGT